ncbi:MAG: hypothetical protein R2707_19815 [Acidimicrobiales bacterium]
MRRRRVGALRRRVPHFLALMVVVLSFAAPSVGAQDAGRVEIPVGTVVRTAPGVETLLGVAAVPPELVGTACGVSTRAENNQSVHPGNNLVVASGGASVTLADVEGSSGKVTTANSRLTLGVEVTITLVMGADGVFSGGASAFVVVDCAPATTTTTSTSSSTTTTTASSSTTTTTASSSTTTSVAPTSSSTVPPTTPTVKPTIQINGPTTTVDGPSSTTTSPPPEPPTLAVTGAGETLMLAIVGLLLLDLGYLIFSTRRPAASSTRDE